MCDVRSWNEVAIQRRVDDGYVNASSMCKAAHKDWFEYYRSSKSAASGNFLSNSIARPLRKDSRPSR